jgi:outer membrane usher protein FimD/PapC
MCIEKQRFKVSEDARERGRDKSENFSLIVATLDSASNAARWTLRSNSGWGKSASAMGTW